MLDDSIAVATQEIEEDSSPSKPTEWDETEGTAVNAFVILISFTCSEIEIVQKLLYCL